MRKKKRIFSFLLAGFVLFCSFFLFSTLIFPKEAPPKSPASSPLTSLPENPTSKIEGNAEPVTTPPNSDPVPNKTGTPGEPEEGSEKTQPPRQQGNEATGEETILEKLSFLQIPLPGAGVTTRDSQLPGAPRDYRHGVHEGLDFYSDYCGIQVNYGDPVFAAGPGVVCRVDHGYQEPAVAERTAMLQQCMEEGDTPEDILDKLRGRQVWIAHSFGVITRYAHLSEVAGYLQEGDPIRAGDYLGNVGNSGTSEGARGEKTNSHLHFEIWLEDGYLGEGLTPQEIRSLWKTLLEKNN